MEIINEDVAQKIVLVHRSQGSRRLSRKPPNHARERRPTDLIHKQPDDREDPSCGEGFQRILAASSVDLLKNCLLWCPHFRFYSGQGGYCGGTNYRWEGVGTAGPGNGWPSSQLAVLAKTGVKTGTGDDFGGRRSCVARLRQE